MNQPHRAVDGETADGLAPRMLGKPLLGDGKFHVLGDLAAGLKDRTEPGCFLYRRRCHRCYLPRGAWRDRDLNHTPATAAEPLRPALALVRSMAHTAVGGRCAIRRVDCTAGPNACQHYS